MERFNTIDEFLFEAAHNLSVERYNIGEGEVVEVWPHLKKGVSYISYRKDGVWSPVRGIVLRWEDSIIFHNHVSNEFLGVMLTGHEKFQDLIDAMAI